MALLWSGQGWLGVHSDNIFCMLLWLMNLDFAGGEVAVPPAPVPETRTGSGGGGKGSGSYGEVEFDYFDKREEEAWKKRNSILRDDEDIILILRAAVQIINKL